MKTVRLDEVSPKPGPATRKRPLSDPLAAEHLAINHYELAPGDSFAFGYHRHDDQEEVFYVLSGTVTFETARGEINVGPDEAIKFAPGEYQRGINQGQDRVVALALGAPKDGTSDDIRRVCPECEQRTSQEITRGSGDDALETRCVECETVTGRFSHGEQPP